MATITEILASDNISDSRGDINTNFSNLNTDKLESSDITGKEDVSNKKTSLADNSDTFYPSQKAVKTAVDAKQDTLVSGTNIKTVNSTTLLGSGDLAVQETLVSGTNIKTINSTSLLGSGNIDIGGGSGDVIAPASNTDNNIPQWDGNNSKTLKDGLSLVTTIGTPGADTSIPTEQAVREAISGAGGGDVSGPASSTDNAITRFDGETGKIIQNSGATIDDSGNVIANNIASGATVSGSNTGDQDLSGYVAKSTYDAHTILQATTDNTPAALTVGEQTVVGRATGGNITALSIDSDLSSVSANDDTIPSAKATKAALDGKLANVVEDTTPQLGGQLDVNGQALGDGTLELLKFEETASAVNEITIKNAATGSAPEVKATGDDTNIDIKLVGKGTGGYIGRKKPRVTSEESSATPTINTDNCDIHRITALTTNITSMTTNLSGTPTHGQTLIIEITGTAARAITWGTSFEASTVNLPTTTVTTAMLSVGFKYNSATSKWRCLASA